MRTVEELEALLETVTRERHELRARLVDAVQERNAARTDWEVCALNLAEVTRERDRSLACWEAAGMQGRSAHSAMLELAQQLDEHREKRNMYAAECVSLRARLVDAQRERDEARAEVEQRDLYIEEIKRDLLMVDEKNGEIGAEVERLMHQLADATNESTHFQVMCKRETEEVERLTSELQRERIGIRPIDEARAEVDRLTDERDELLVRVANQDAELRATREAYRDAYRRLCAPMWEEP
jgi:chromosome segregation ATPase